MTPVFITFTSKQIKESLTRQENLLSQASKEVKQFCDDHMWVAEIHQFVNSWVDVTSESWNGQPAITIEVII